MTADRVATILAVCDAAIAANDTWRIDRGLPPIVTSESEDTALRGRVPGR